MALVDAITRKLRNAAKAGYQRFRFSRDCAKTVGFIMGVQRSGTGMLNQAFENDWNCVAFGERGGLSITQQKYEWKPYAEVATILKRQRAPLLVAKPLVEIGRAEELLSVVPAKVIWMFRHYEDVCKSGQQQFGLDAIRRNLQSVLEPDGHWYSLNMDDEQRRLVSRYYSGARSEHDLRALGWYVRNLWYFRLRHTLPIMLIRYEDLVSAPSEQMRRVYEFLGVPYPGDYIVSHIHRRSVKRGEGVEISTDIRGVCDSMLEKLSAPLADF